MDDSRFAVVMFLAYVAVGVAVGALAMWIALHGTHECSVEMSIGGQTATYITECVI